MICAHTEEGSLSEDAGTVHILLIEMRRLTSGAKSCLRIIVEAGVDVGLGGDPCGRLFIQHPTSPLHLKWGRQPQKPRISSHPY